MGSDIQRYDDWYTYRVKPLDNFSFEDFRYEPIFCLLISLFKTIGISWFVVHAIIITFINYSVFTFGFKYVKPFFTFILLYYVLHFYEINFEVLRQSIAMGIFLLSFPLLEKGKKINYFFCIAIAFGFHISSVLAIFLPFVKRIKFNLFTYIYIVTILFVGDYVNSHFSDIIVLSSLIGGEEYYELYLKSDSVNNQLNINGILVLLVVKVIPILLTIKMLKKTKVVLLPYIEAVAFILVTFMTLSAAIPLFERFALFWGIIQVAILSEGMYITNVPRNSSLLNICLRGYLVLAFIINTGMYYMAENEYGFKNYRRFYPYNSILEKNNDSERRNKQLYI